MNNRCCNYDFKAGRCKTQSGYCPFKEAGKVCKVGGIIEKNAVISKKAVLNYYLADITGKVSS